MRRVKGVRISKLKSLAEGKFRKKCVIFGFGFFTVVFAYKNHPVYKVDLQGVIVRVENREKFNKYTSEFLY